MHRFRLDRPIRAAVAAAALAAAMVLAPAAHAQGTYMGDADRVTTIPAPQSYGGPAGGPYGSPSGVPSGSPGYGPPPGYPQSYPPPNYPPPNYPPPNYPSPQADGPGPGYAPGAPAPAGPQGAPYDIGQDELDGLVAPVALYPDQLLAQVFMAATFPLDVIEAARFERENPNLTGRALDDAVAGRRWDPSVLSLVAFPQVLAMMNEHLDWTRRLGEAFVADQDRVMQTVQDLRFRAQQAGTLQSTAQQNVIVQDRAIYIEPAQPDVVYVPVYNPTVVYGAWWAPTYVPWYWRPAGVYFAGPIGFYGGYRLGPNHWGWARPDWSHRHIAIDVSRHNRFIDRRPYYRDSIRDGRWQFRGGSGWQGDRARTPQAASGVPRGNFRPDRPVRTDSRVLPERQGGVVQGPRESGNEAGSGQPRGMRGAERGVLRGDAATGQARTFRAPPGTADAGARPLPQRAVVRERGDVAARQVERAPDGGARRVQAEGRGRGEGRGEGRHEGAPRAEGRANER